MREVYEFWIEQECEEFTGIENKHFVRECVGSSIGFLVGWCSIIFLSLLPRNPSYYLKKDLSIPVVFTVYRICIVKTKDGELSMNSSGSLFIHLSFNKFSLCESFKIFIISLIGMSSAFLNVLRTSLFIFIMQKWIQVSMKLLDEKALSIWLIRAVL